MNFLSNFLVTPVDEEFRTNGEIIITRSVQKTAIMSATDGILQKINTQKGALFSSSYEYPNRYSRWDIGFINPCMEIRTLGKNFEIKALNKRGEILIEPILKKLENCPEVLEVLAINYSYNCLQGTVKESTGSFPEEQRSKQPTVFSVLRAVKELFYLPNENFLGLYGAFGYDLVFQFEPMDFKHKRDDDQPDLVLYLPDDLVVVDHQLSVAYNVTYEFSFHGKSTIGLERSGEFTGHNNKTDDKKLPDHTIGKYADLVREAVKSFNRGDLFEVVASQTLYKHCPSSPSEIFLRLKRINPSPYGFIINLGNEFLIGASPEMFLRVEGNRIETCPISGTIKRGKDAIEDSIQIKKLLNSYKDESELTMCTDVDRNDKSRVCIPGSVKILGRRQIEMYSHLIHTVDHVEGILRDEFDSLDAFLTHMWAVTVTGAPKRAAIRWLEIREEYPRKWYGGAIGFMNFNGNMNTGLTLRTVRLKNGVAEIRVGATLLYDSIPEEEENETYLKAGAILKSINADCKPEEEMDFMDSFNKAGKGKRILLVDHEDSFVHTLANYFKQTGAEVMVLRAPLARKMLGDDELFNLVLLSPGPGRPCEFDLNETIDLCIRKQIPIFGVCLGLQGIVEYFGGELGQLSYPQHGKSSLVKICHASHLWHGLPGEFKVGRYHSLYALNVPASLNVTAVDNDGIVMAIEHKDLPITAVQFHPESILTLEDNIGFKIVENIVTLLS
ncbi:MAG TPA: anthranilate synthase component I [Methylomusa anaerophila]|uniref:Anthranilate synthase n=1 Tax=Methylomusa anaerophila TaxID=1930071 RepID=A0A348AEJ1_9FIRM|nr:anthranilate synthase component I [Methylomusa anaerophila]BBB89489.1 anthranilate synthase component 1 [Methylomusa anaerophila]HML89720.1 anthranilate synthase component I [Methylomusa anaerophila]